ncbi:alpha-1:3/1:6-mannosyltransferase ALG2-like protein [Leptotrombidium deliense]|uniref:Alpha-1,3/1,6-mannosyltransferase ALG2 n=1 Tax=Leptotrombidium deliense TaxID=299467 RepID=A0A443SH12_9ACAR|nr:alpha-1:3/1:6-mannosyltransferase ALG2-like protein [Leptotrombidium deliense]
MRVLFIHPDLGIGGAERLVVDVGVSLQQLGHSVHFVTCHHNREHCFKETIDGTLSLSVIGDWMPRSIFGKCYAMCAYLRVIIAALYVVFSRQEQFDYQLVFCDQISACIPIFKWFSALNGKKSKIVFYCHFPDQLLTERNSFWKKMYRLPIDWLEEVTTGLADCVLVNSNFTAHVFRKTFSRLSNVPIDVLHPTCNFAVFDRPVNANIDDLKLNIKADSTFLSINRYERKKNLELSLEALADLLKRLRRETKDKNVHLIIAGGFDERVIENKEYFDELIAISKNLGVENNVSFLKSPSDSQKHLLLHSCTAVLYTPQNEHFGIVPLEAMYMKRAVIACNSGGPLETIVDGETGFLCDPKASSFSEAMYKFVCDKSLALEFGVNGREHVQKHFAYSTFKRNLDKMIQKLK